MIRLIRGASARPSAIERHDDRKKCGPSRSLTVRIQFADAAILQRMACTPGEKLRVDARTNERFFQDGRLAERAIGKT